MLVGIGAWTEDPAPETTTTTTDAGATTLVKIMQALETKIRQHHANVKSRKAKDQAEKAEIDALRDVLKDAMQAALMSCLEDGCLEDVALAGNLAQGQALWMLRENITHAQQMDGSNIKHDVSLPISRIRYMPMP